MTAIFQHSPIAARNLKIHVFPMRIGFVRVVLLGALVPLTGCYALRSSSGGGQTSNASRRIAAEDVALPSGYKIEAVASGLTFPTGACFDDQNNLYVIESGYSYGEVFTVPKLLRVGAGGNLETIATGQTNGPWTGVTFVDGNFFIAEGGVMQGGKILRVAKDGKISAIVEGLPSLGDHHTDGPAAGPDGFLYFGQGTASNSGVVGEDNSKFGWLKRHPDFHDVPGQDITLVGVNFESKDVAGHTGKTARTGAYVPFGQTTEPGQKIKGALKCSGAVLRVKPDGSNLELVAWGFRNPFGLAFSADGKLFVTDNGYDERGSRPVWGAPDLLWQVDKGKWYGWPDYSGSEPLTLEKFKAPGKPQPKFLLADHPGTPPDPVAKFGVHSSADGLDFSRNASFGHVGEAFIALVGDEAPATGKLLHAVGFKVVRVNVSNGVVEDFAVNKGPHNGPASKLHSGGLERPVAARFSPSGDALYVIDFGVVLHDKSGAKPKTGTGVIWKITRSGQ
jgi:glucose/arabinose dehydrogenase